MVVKEYDLKNEILLMRRALPKCFPFVPPVSEVQANLTVTLCKKSKGGAAGHFTVYEQY